MLPELRTPRLLLRAFTRDDAAALTAALGAREVSDTTLSIPHPYERSMADSWIAGLAAAFERRELAVFAVADGSGELVGSVALALGGDGQGELGYWTALPHWGKGYSTEAARALVAWGFESLGLHRVHAHHFARNPASGRVLRKLGMREEGVLRRHVMKNGRFEDVVCYGLAPGGMR